MFNGLEFIELGNKPRGFEIIDIRISESNIFENAKNKKIIIDNLKNELKQIRGKKKQLIYFQKLEENNKIIVKLPTIYQRDKLIDKILSFNFILEFRFF